MEPGQAHSDCTRFFGANSSGAADADAYEGNYEKLQYINIIIHTIRNGSTHVGVTLCHCACTCTYHVVEAGHGEVASVS